MKTLEDIKAFYQTQYPAMHPDLDAGDVEWKFQLIRSLLDNLDKSGIKRVLEIGSGAGKLLERTSSCLNADGTGMDISFTILSKAHSMSKGIQLIQGSADDLPFIIEKFDMVYFADLLEHLKQPGRFLSGLTAANSLIMLVPLEAGLISNLLFYYRSFAGKPTTREIYGHLNRWNRKGILRLISNSGLKLSSYKILRVKITQYQSRRGKVYSCFSELIYSILPSLHERLFGGWTFVGLCKK